MSTWTDRHGKTIAAGNRIIWKEHGSEYTGIVEANSRYSDGMAVGGRSVKNIWEDCDWILVVSPVN